MHLGKFGIIFGFLQYWSDWDIGREGWIWDKFGINIGNIGRNMYACFDFYSIWVTEI